MEDDRYSAPCSYLQISLLENNVDTLQPFGIDDLHFPNPSHLEYDKNTLYNHSGAHFDLLQAKLEPEEIIEPIYEEVREVYENKESDKALSRARHTLQQRIKRQNETPEQRLIRRQRNAELNRRRRQNKADLRVAMEKVKNRLRQRIKREIDRMLRTRQKRDDFLRETFEQMEHVFSDADMIQYHRKVLQVLDEISQ